MIKDAAAAGSATSHFSVTVAGKWILGWVVAVRFGEARRLVAETADRCHLAVAAAAPDTLVD